MLEARDLRYMIGYRRVLRGIDLRIGPGECLGLFGPNGAGKTTLLSILSLQRPPTSGEVRLFGRNAAIDDLALRRRLGYLGHEPGVFLGLTGYENLAFYARLYRLDRIPERVEARLREVGLSLFRHDLVRGYSAGMRQRLALARATLHEPEILLLDEPHHSLDPAGADLLDETVRRHLHRGGTALFATHELQRGYDLATHLAVLHRGRLTWQGATATDDAKALQTAVHEALGDGVS